MARIHTTVIFLSRATRSVGAFCVFVWLIAAGMALFSDPQFPAQLTSELIAALWPASMLYLAPGLVLFLCGALVRTGRLWAGVIILVVSILSLFKLAFLLLPMPGPYWSPPVGCELPVRLLCALLSVACAYAWEDLIEMNRTRPRRPRGSPRIVPTPPAVRFSAPAPARHKVPPPSTKIPRPKLRREKPPDTKTPRF